MGKWDKGKWRKRDAKGKSGQPGRIRIKWQRNWMRYVRE